MSASQPYTIEQEMVRQTDRTMRELIVLLVRQQDARLTPNTIDGVRRILVAGFLEYGRLAVVAANTNASQSRMKAAGPWDDEPTDPQRPSNRPRKP